MIYYSTEKVGAIINAFRKTTRDLRNDGATNDELMLAMMVVVPNMLVDDNSNPEKAAKLKKRYKEMLGELAIEAGVTLVMPSKETKQ